LKRKKNVLYKKEKKKNELIWRHFLQGRKDKSLKGGRKGGGPS